MPTEEELKVEREAAEKKAADGKKGRWGEWPNSAAG